MFRHFAIATASVLFAGTASAAVVFTVSDRAPDPSGSGNLLTTTADAPATISSSLLGTTVTYTIADLDLTSVGGTANETIVYDVVFTQTGGTGIGFTAFGNAAVTGGGNNDNFIDGAETLTATVSLNSTTFAGTVDIGIVTAGAGATNNGEAWDVVHDSGTTAGANPNFITATFPSSSFATLDPTSTNATINFQRLDFEVTAVPEPGPLALLGMSGLLIARRRRG